MKQPATLPTLRRQGAALTVLALAVVLALAPLPFHIRWIDGRRNSFPDLPLARVEQVTAGTPSAELKFLRAART